MMSIDALINRQILRWELERRVAEQPRRSPDLFPYIVTVSRQSGSRGSWLAHRLAETLGYQRLHREVIDCICQTSGYRKRIVAALDDHVSSHLDRLAETFFTGQSVDHSDYRRVLVQVILSMSRLGGVILMGRGGNLILGPNRGFHLRVICPLEQRVENLVRFAGVTAGEARKRIDRQDHDRRQFICQNFDADIDNPALYDLVVNTGFIDIEDLLAVTVSAVKGKFSKLQHLPEQNH